MRETICFRVLPLHLQCFRCAGAQHSCSLQEFQCSFQLTQTHKLPHHSTTKQAELPSLNCMGTCDFEYIHRQNDVSRAPHLADLLTAPEATWRKRCVPCSCCRLQRHALSSWKSQQGLVLCGTAGLHLSARSQPGFYSTSAKIGRAAPTQQSVHSAALCSPKSQRMATEKDQSSHCGNSGISAAHSVERELDCSLQLPEGYSLVRRGLFLSLLSNKW